MKNAKQFACRFENEGGRVQNSWPITYATNEAAARAAVLRHAPDATRIRITFIADVCLVDTVRVHGERTRAR